MKNDITGTPKYPNILNNSGVCVFVFKLNRCTFACIWACALLLLSPIIVTFSLQVHLFRCAHTQNNNSRMRGSKTTEKNKIEICMEQQQQHQYTNYEEAFMEMEPYHIQILAKHTCQMA